MTCPIVIFNIALLTATAVASLVIDTLSVLRLAFLSYRCGVTLVDVTITLDTAPARQAHAARDDITVIRALAAGASSVTVLAVRTSWAVCKWMTKSVLM